jgi:hypothetical protein
MLVFWEVLKAHVATSPKIPKTIHYRGDGGFVVAGAETRKYRKLFGPRVLEN